VVDAGISAELAQESMLGGARRPGDMSPAFLGDLYGEVTDTAGRGVDQHPLPGP
jgi:hypothetical protein